MQCSDLADRYENEPDVFKMVYRALSLRAGHVLSHNMLKAVDASKKPLENIFRTVRVQRRVQDVEEKLQVREALSVRPDPKSREKGSKSTNFFSRRKPD